MIRAFIPRPLRIFRWRVRWLLRTQEFHHAPWRSLAKLVGWSLRELFTREISFTCPRGKSYVTMANNFTSVSLYLTGYRDREIQEYLEKIATKDWVFCDLGANIGAYAIASAHGMGHVFAFEAHPYTYGFLKRNVELNGLGNVTVINKALGDIPGTINMAFHAENPGETHVGEAGDPVSLVRLDDELSARAVDRVDYIKIDVEGFELPVLRGAIETLTRNQAIIVQVEMVDRHARRYGYSLADLVAFMTDLSFRPHRVGQNHHLDRLPPQQPLYGDILWIR